LADNLVEKANSWAAPRALFDAAIEYLAHNKIAIPAYSTLQFARILPAWTLDVSFNFVRLTKPQGNIATSI